MPKFKVTFRGAKSVIVEARNKEDVRASSLRWDIKRISKVM